MNTRHFGPDTERGAALIAALVILLILLVLGVTTMNMTTLEERMAFNSQERYAARYQAESLALAVADPDNLPNPAQPGESRNAWAFADGGSVVLPSGASLSLPGVAQADVAVTYVQSTSAVNLPMPNPIATLPSAGGQSGQRPVFEIAAEAETATGTRAVFEFGAYYFSNSNN